MKIQLTEDEEEQFIRDDYVVVKGLLSPKLVANIKDRLYSRLGITPNDSTTPRQAFISRGFGRDRTTNAARNAEFESVAEQLVGDDTLKGECFSAVGAP